MPSERLQFAVEAVRAAGRLIRKFDMHRGDLRVEYKGPGNPVTNADLAAESMVLERIADAYPGDGVLSEESGASGNQDSCWVLDPIDGTTNFIHGVPGYAVSLAWCREGTPCVGVIYDVVRDALYTAESGRGSLCDDRRIRVSTTRRLEGALLGSTGSAGTQGWRWQLLANVSKRSAGFRRLGAGTLDFAMAAQGSLDACFGANLHYWDYAAGSLILREAGGQFVDLEGKAEVQFGTRLGFCIFGCPRIVGNIRRLADQLHAAEG